MTSGTISGNTASTSGGGVYNTGTVTMTSGTISGNTASNYGGGVNNSGTFTMNGGTISGNTSSFYSGGVENLKNLYDDQRHHLREHGKLPRWWCV